MGNATPFGAGGYDGGIAQTLPYYEEMHQQVLEVAATLQRGPLSWLDVGCGTGLLAQLALERLPVRRLVLCDKNPGMLKAAGARLKGRPDAVEFALLAAHALPYREEFDVVTALLVNHYAQWEERRKAVENCWRALRPGGLFFTFGNFAPYSAAGQRLYLQRWKNYQIERGKSPQESQAHIARYGAGYYPITLTQQLEVLHQCGFDTAEVLWVSYLQAGFLGIKP